MLLMKPGCECCDTDLAPQSEDALICSFECTFCTTCAEQILGGICPNCGGQLTARPTRAAHLLQRFPATAERTYNPQHAK